MSNEKVFYWIKLKESFYTNNDAIDFLMAQEGGANYVVLYQMLCLKTVNTNGNLFRNVGEVIIPFDAEKIQRDCRYFSIDTVRIALNLYKSLGLIYEQEDGLLRISDFDSMVGSAKTDDHTRELGAERQQRFRDKQKSLSVTVTDNVTLFRNAEIEIENRDRDRDKDIKKSSHFVPPSLEEVKAYCDERKNGINAESFIDFYSAKNWMIGKNKMSDWKACVRTWEKRKKESPELTARDIKMGHTTPEDQKTRISDDDMRKLIMRGRMKRES